MVDDSASFAAMLGFAVAAQSEFRSAVPSRWRLVVMSGAGNEERQLRACQAGAAGTVEKNGSLEVLFAVVHRVASNDPGGVGPV